MGGEKRNAFLDAEESDHDLSQGYDSEAGELQKGGRNAKRRKTDAESDLSEEEPDREPGSGVKGGDEDEEAADVRDELDDDDDDLAGKISKETSSSEKHTPKQLKLKNILNAEAAIRKSGVVYLSRIPPLMRPRKLRSLLEPLGTIKRTYLSEEDAAARTRRLRAGGSRKRLYTEGWVEFARKRDAKAAAELLNASTVGGKKGGYFRDAVWSVVYLRGFKWHHLTEQIAAENAARESRLRAEIGKAERENREFVRNVERAKMLDGMEAKAEAKRKRKRGGGDGGNEGEGKDTSLTVRARGGIRTFKQTSVVRKGESNEEPSERVSRVLGSIF